MAKLWGGRFSKKTNPTLEKLNCSINLDQRLFREDIKGSKAYAKALLKVGLLTEQENNAIFHGLNQVEDEWSQNKFQIVEGDEDIHTANERRLKELIGEPATKLHVGRSRNDQVVTDVKLWMIENLQKLHDKLRGFIKVMAQRAVKEIDVIMPGYTHLQRAQPVRWSHFILSHTWNFKTDVEKLWQVVESCRVMPLGSGALAGNPFNINRESLAEELGFRTITNNSMQAVSDRDFIADFLYWSSMVGVHLSRLAEDLILYSTKEFSFVKVHDSLSTGSSLMPQKCNPDSLELIRGIGGSLFGQLTSVVMTLKGLPSTYNKDLQGDKEALFSTFDKLESILDVSTLVVESLSVNAEACASALSYDMLATDIAYYLVRKGIPFRLAHEKAGRVVACSEKLGVNMSEVPLEKLQEICCEFEATEFSKLWNYENSVEQYTASGGTSRQSVLGQVHDLKSWLTKTHNY